MTRLAALPPVTAAMMLAFQAEAHAEIIPIAPRKGGSPNADRIYDLYMIVMGVAAVIFVAVMGALFYALWKFRARPGREAKQFHGNTRLEIGATVGAALICLVLGTVTFIALPGIRNPDNSDADGWAAPVVAHKAADLLPPNKRALNIRVNGQQYAWRFVYPDTTATLQDNLATVHELVVPTGTTVTLDITSSDVGHAWWIPELGGKSDALPGYTNHSWFKVPSSALRTAEEKQNGRVFRGQCAELCGRNHGNMTAQVRALTPEKFEKWLSRTKRDHEEAAKETNAYRVQQQKYDLKSKTSTTDRSEANGVSKNADQAITEETPAP